MSDQDSWFRRGLVEEVTEVEREEAKTPLQTVNRQRWEVIVREDQ